MENKILFEAIILSGGFGTRLQSVSNGKPKVMMEVGNQPFLYKLMKNLENFGCERIILALHYKSSSIIEQILKDQPVSCTVEFSEEAEPLGTGGATKLAAKNIAGRQFLVINGDTFCDVNYTDFWSFGSETENTILATDVVDRSRFGGISINENQDIISFDEKCVDTGGMINGGSYILSKKQILSVKMSNFSLEKDYFPRLIGNAKAYQHKGIFIDIGVPDSLIMAQQLFQ